MRAALLDRRRACTNDAGAHARRDEIYGIRNPSQRELVGSQHCGGRPGFSINYLKAQTSRLRLLYFDTLYVHVAGKHVT